MNAKIPDITVNEVKKKIDAGEKPKIIDIRKQKEWIETGVIESAELWAAQDFIHELNTTDLAEKMNDTEVILMCRSGNRSHQLTNALVSQTKIKAINMLGGIVDWKKNGYPVVKADI